MIHATYIICVFREWSSFWPIPQLGARFLVNRNRYGKWMERQTSELWSINAQEYQASWRQCSCTTLRTYSVGFLIAQSQEQIFDFQINGNIVKKIRCTNSYRKFAECLSHKGFGFGQNILCITKNCLLLHLWYLLMRIGKIHAQISIRWIAKNYLVFQLFFSVYSYQTRYNLLWKITLFNVLEAMV